MPRRVWQELLQAFGHHAVCSREVGPVVKTPAVGLALLASIPMLDSTPGSLMNPSALSPSSVFLPHAPHLCPISLPAMVTSAHLYRCNCNSFFQSQPSPTFSMEVVLTLAMYIRDRNIGSQITWKSQEAESVIYTCRFFSQTRI